MKNNLIIDKNRDEFIPELLNNNNCKIGIEIGVYEGTFSKHILSNWGGKLFLIDPWRPLGNDYDDISNHSFNNNIYKTVIENTKGFENRSFMLRGLSEDFYNIFSDNFFDFVYIDGNHSYEFVKKDIELWWNKIKNGGYLMGHDYLKLDWYNDSIFAENGKDKYIYGIDGTYIGVFGVNPAVDEFVEKNDLTFYLTNDWFSTFIIKK